VKAWARSSEGVLFDRLLAGLFLVAAEIELAFDGHRANPLLVDALVLAVLMLAFVRRRQSPVAVSLVAAAAASFLVIHGEIQPLNLPMVVLFVPPYSVARYATWGRATVGLVVSLMVPLVLAITSPTQSGLVFNIGAVITSWTVGRAVRASHLQAEALRRRKVRTEVEREERQRRAIVGERARIALELQAVVVDSVSDMVLQAETADRFLGESPDSADDCMESVQRAAHQVLDDMRRVLGILRDPDRSFDLAPLPGLADLGSLRGGDGRALVLTVHGSVPALPASLDLALYRLVQSGLDTATERPATEPLTVSIRFSAARVEVELSVAGGLCVGWPTVSMREWVGLCGGQIGTTSAGSSGERLTVAIPQPSGVYA
jgi:signal transduction histidine kinase